MVFCVESGFMAFNDGDFIEVEYSLWSDSDGKLVATTNESKAKGEGIYDKDVRYGPVLVVLGSNTVVPGLEKALHAMSVNEQKKVQLKPEEAFGARNEDLVRVMPIAEFRKNDINPYPGMRINLDNVQATVKSVNSGRVVVDANSPYAGRDVTYDARVVRQLSSVKDKVEALGRTYNIVPTKVDVKDRSIEISFDDSVKKNADYFVSRANLIASVFSYFKDIDTIKIGEEYNRPKEEKTAKKEATP